MVKFTYNGRVYSPSDLDKKLKKMGITRSDIIIIEEAPIKKDLDVKYKYEYRLNVNSILCANTLEQLNKLKEWYGISIE